MVSVTATAATLLEETDEVFLTLLEITKEDDSILYLAANTEAVVSNGETYEAFPFELIFPSQTDSEPVAKLRVANIDQRIGEEIQLLSDPAPVTFLRVLASSPDTVEDTYPGYELFDVSWDAMVVEGSLTQAQYTQEPWPAKRITPDKYPSIFM